MRSLRCILAFGLCALFLLGSSLNAQDLVPLFYNASDPGTISQYPIYFFANFDEYYSTSSNTSNRTNKITWIPYGSGSGDYVLGDLRKRQLMRAILDNEGLNYCALSDFVDIITVKHGSNDYGISTTNYGLLVDGGRKVSTSFFASDTYPYLNYNNYLAVYTLKGYVFFRPNTVLNVYDVFYYFFLAPASPDGASANSNIWQLREDPSNKTAYLYPTHTELTVSDMRTYQFCGTFTVEITNSSYDFDAYRDASPYSLPLDIDDVDGQIVFATNAVKNYYWATWADLEATSTTYPSLSVNFAIDGGSGANVSVWPYYSQLSLRTASSSNLIAFGSNDNLLESRFLFALDSDEGGMKDVNEWYQTKHDVLDPSDDNETTEELEPELPEPEEGEYVVDAGKDTVDRYRRYWDEVIGTDEELGEVTLPELDDPEDLSINPPQFEYIYHEADNAWKAGFDDNSKFKTTLDSTFSTLNNADSLSWQFNPSIQSNLVSVALPSVSINPSEWIRDPVYGVYFTTFRGCLLLCEFLYFCYSLYKLALSALTGSGSGDSTGDGND